MTTDELDALSTELRTQDNAITAESLHRNAEMIALRNHLMGDKP